MSSIFVQNAAGIIVGAAMGFLGYFFKYIQTWKYCINLKCAYCLIMSIAFIVASELSTFKNAKYIACLTFGYVCFRMWGDHKPSKQIADCWFYIQPFLFGTIGAALLFSQLRAADVGRSFVCIIVGQIMRFVGAFMTSTGGKYTIRERIFIALSWIPKSTVPATLASVVYTDSKALGADYLEYQQWGLNIQTTTILSIIVCEPIGSFLID